LTISYFYIGRYSKSQRTSNDLSSSSSSSSLSIVPLRKKSLSHRATSPTQVVSSLSDDSLSEQLQSKQSHRSRSRSTYIPTNYSSPPSSVYLRQLSNKTNSFGLTKTITSVWKNTKPKSDEEENYFYSRCSIERVQPIINNDNRSIPILSRNIILQRGQTDYWQNYEISPDAIITSSCEDSTGSASDLLSPSTNLKQTKNHMNSNGHIISITTTKRHQPSLLNKSKNIQWNIEGDGKQLRYSRIQWHSDDQFDKRKHSGKKSRTKHLADSNTDTGSSSEQKNQSVPIILHHEGIEYYFSKSAEVIFPSDEMPDLNLASL
jgi:hypothetical protein